MNPKRRGYSLLLAIVLIGAVGVTIGLMGRHVVAQTRWVRRAVLDIHAAQMISDGQVWVATHPADCRRLESGGRITLAVDSTSPLGGGASLEVERSDSGIVIVRARVTAGRLSVTHQTGAAVPDARSPHP